MEIISIVLPIFGIVGVGYLLRHFKVVTDNWIHTLNAFTYYVALPAIVVSSFWPIDWFDGEILNLVWHNALVLSVFSVLVFLVLSTVKADRKTKAAIYLAALVGNTVYMGYPLVGNAVAKDHFSLVAAVSAVQLTLSLVFTAAAVEYWVVKSKKISRYAKDFAKNPMVLAMVAGIILSFVNLGPVRQPLEKMVAMFGATASPVALFALGGFLHGKFYQQHFRFTLLPTLLKLMAFPLFVALSLPFAGIDGDALLVSVLLSAMPTAVTAFVISEKYDLEETFVANCILVSTLASLFTISALLSLY